MHPDEIYALTPLGESQLRSSGTSLTPVEIDVLVRFDGILTVGQLMAGLSAEGTRTFGTVFRDLRDRNLLALVEMDPFMLQWNAGMDQFARAVGPAEADRGLASLQRSGFYVEIARERPSAQPAGRLPQGAPGKLTVLMVEDDAALARFTQMLLSLSGFEVRQAGNRAEVVAEIRRPPVPDLILLDVMLPDTDGFDILKRVRQHPALVNVPVIMLTGKATREAVIKGMSAGADGYITKPFEPEALMRAVRTVLGLPEQRGTHPWVNSDAH
jgi:two-component system, OmpR family, response regulator